MNKASTYLLSLIFSVFLVFLMIAGSAVLLFDINFTPNKLKKLADKKDTESKIYTEIDKYYSDKYNTTGIPADVYMSAVDKGYIKLCEYSYIDCAFESLKSGTKLSMTFYDGNDKICETPVDSTLGYYCSECGLMLGVFPVTHPTGFAGRFNENIDDSIDVLPQKKCPECGAEIDMDYPRCPFCGYIYEIL